MAVLLTGVAHSAAAKPVNPNRAATSAYIPARHRLFSALLASVKSSAPSLAAYVQTVAAECPGVLVTAPQGTQLFAFFQEEIDAFFMVLAPRRGASAVRFADAVKPLKWSSDRLTRAIRADANGDVKETKEQTPNLCADYRAWAASGYKALPAETKRLDAETPPRFGKSELGDVNQGLWNKLSPYETKSMRKLGRETQKLEGEFAASFLSLSLGASHELRKRLGFTGSVLPL